ncbi:hypothetical protein BJV74DRAFT_821624 [Russula compacta]|nr:hypothetical protein BJV74DRAFT_821624 [Russula compacta]
MSQSDYGLALGYNFLIVGDRDAGIRGVVSAYLEEPTPSGLPTSFLRANQKAVTLADNSVLILDIIGRPGDIFRECCGDLARSHGVLLVYNPTILTSFQYVLRFHEQLLKSKWKYLPVVLFSNTSTQRSVRVVSRSHGRDFANKHAIPFIEASPGRPCSAPFPVLLKLVRQSYEASTPTSFGEGVIDFLTVAAAKASHVARSHFHALPHTRECGLAQSSSAPRCGTFYLRSP